jgi:hypothetical protein
MFALSYFQRGCQSVGSDNFPDVSTHGTVCVMNTEVLMIQLCSERGGECVKWLPE